MKAARLEKLLAPLFDVEKDAATLLEGLSCVAHMPLILWRQHKTNLMTGQLYHDTQAIFFCIIHAKKHCPAEPFLMHQVAADGLKNAFAVARTLIYASNLDTKELGVRLGAAVSLEKI
ncbi:unnamed protein product [Scytosiphon promiscuus]